MSNNNLDKIFKDGLKDAKVSPPDHVWARIQASGVVQPAPNRGVIMMKTIRWAAAAVIALLMTIGGFWIFQKESATSGEPQIAEEKVTPKDQNDLQETKSKSILEARDTGSQYVLENANTSGHSELQETETPSEKVVPKRKQKSQRSKYTPQKSINSESTPMNQEKDIQIAEVELIIPTQKLETLEPAYIESNHSTSNSGLASLDYGSVNDVAVKFSVDPNALIYAAENLGRERTVRERLFDKAGEKMTDLAEAAGFPVRRWSKIKEVEILY